MTPPPTSTPALKKTLGLTGVTVNAMALIAPGAFLWITMQVQAANTGGDTDMWTGIVAALVVAFLTAMAFAELARRYPEAGAGGSYYFAEKAFLDREQAGHRRFARLAKFGTGWAAHLFYWVYPGVMVAMMATLVTYLLSQFNINATIPQQIVIAVLFSVAVGFIAVRGITGSTNLAIVINVIQLVSLVGFSIMAIMFRIKNPLHATQWAHPHAMSIVFPHSLGAMLFQSTIAMLILVGFESSTSLAGEAKNPKKDIPRGIILSLVIQGVFAYLLEYFAANYAVCEKLVNVAPDGTRTTGMAAVAASGAPVGDMIRMIGDSMFGGNGFMLMIVVALTVGLAVLGTTLAAMNTAVRISFAMAQDKEMPSVMGALHGKHATPHMGVWLLVGVSAILGAVGVCNVTALTGITLASNIGTFILYGMICALTFVAFAGQSEFHSGRHAIVPLLGLLGNLALLVGIVVIGLKTPGVSANATRFALWMTAGWGTVSAVYLVWNSRSQKRALLPTTHAG
jgi:amino acid transporter